MMRMPMWKEYLEREFGCPLAALRGKIVLIESTNRPAIFLGLLVDERGDTFAIVEEKADGHLYQAHPSQLSKIPAKPPEELTPEEILAEVDATELGPYEEEIRNFVEDSFYSDGNHDVRGHFQDPVATINFGGGLFRRCGANQRGDVLPDIVEGYRSPGESPFPQIWEAMKRDSAARFSRNALSESDLRRIGQWQRWLDVRFGPKGRQTLEEWLEEHQDPVFRWDA